jgi:hypothetical protein
MVYGELGRYPLNIHINVRMIGFWLKLKSSNKLSSNEKYATLCCQTILVVNQ